MDCAIIRFRHDPITTNPQKVLDTSGDISALDWELWRGQVGILESLEQQSSSLANKSKAERLLSPLSSVETATNFCAAHLTSTYLGCKDHCGQQKSWLMWVFVLLTTLQL